MNQRIVCLDIGDVRIGVAVSDPTGTIASPVEVIRRVGWGPDTRRICSICEQYGTRTVLSGLPLNMDGTEGFQAAKVREFCGQLEKAGLTVIFQDERLSTVSAEEALLEGNVSRRDRKGKVDKIAAAIILKQWLDANQESSKEDKPVNDDLFNAPEDEIPEGAEALSEGDIIEMINEDGQTVPFIFVDAFEFENDMYLALAEPEEEDAVFFMKIEEDEEGNDTYTAADEALEDALFLKFMELRNEPDQE